MLSVWWDFKGVLYWELLPTNTTVTAEVYIAQLEKLKNQIEIKRPELEKIYFLHDNARPHVALSTRKKLMEFDWKLLPHPPYSPDLAPTDYHLFRAMRNSLRDKTFEKEEDVKTYLDDFFNSKNEKFYQEGIESLRDRWRLVVDN